MTTLDAAGHPHLAPMGPVWDRSQPQRLILRPFPTANTGRNLLRHPEGVFHVTDDALLLAQAAIGRAVPFPPVRSASQIRGVVLEDCCRYYEFVVERIETTGERLWLEARIVHQGWVRDFIGFHRARHAIVEAAILATRLHLLPWEEVAAEYRKLRVIVDKTGDEPERQAMALLEQHLVAVRAGQLREKEASPTGPPGAVSEGAGRTAGQEGAS
ncbi:MAG: DUF447 family protein [Gemmataceae bacterium]|nr:DUF447 family protein [Gemmataceae bacterium]MCS7270676.1 DUF447 family protein [Gemmataceae bacterium]MDW8242992.1 DUF447 family protein [Thermogemmata sp.]